MSFTGSRASFSVDDRLLLPKVGRACGYGHRSTGRDREAADLVGGLIHRETSQEVVTRPPLCQPFGLSGRVVAFGAAHGYGSALLPQGALR